jgi:hypothetical protein
MDQRPVPPPPVKRNWLPIVALLAACVALISTGLMASGWIRFDGDWDGPLGLVNGRSGRVWIVIPVAWTYLVPTTVISVLAILTTLGSLIGWVVHDGMRAKPKQP